MNNIIKNKELELQIENLGSNGEGIARFNNGVIFVPGALPGETVIARIDLIKKNYAVAKLRKLIQRSSERVWPRCAFYEKCGGCQLQHLEYQAQLRLKERMVQDALIRIGHIKASVLPIKGAINSWYYRNKMQFPVGSAMGKISIGCYEKQTHNVVDTTECIIQNPGNNIALAAVREWMNTWNISAYNEINQDGLIRHVMARTAKNGQIMVVLITKHREIPHKEELIKILQSKIQNLCSVIQNVNDRNTNIILGNKSVVLWGSDVIKDCLGKFVFRISAESFFQINTEQAEVLYETVLKYAKLTGKENVADVYCGTGTISLYLSQHAKYVYGIEIVSSAIFNAKQNKKDNGMDNTEFICGDAVQELPRLINNGIKLDVVVVDPPRAGCDEKVLHTIVEADPKRIIYVSCNPATLARDLNYLSNQYNIEEVQPVDMFPQTVHVETVVLLERK